jgi:hypothetical protein
MMACIPFLDMDSNGDFTFDFSDSATNTSPNAVTNNTSNRADNFRSPTESEIRDAIESGDLSSLEY